MTRIPLGPGREFDRIRDIVAALGPAAGTIGSDAALVAPDDGTLVVSIDASVEGVHFRRHWLTPEELGWRAAAAALSDIAAAAAMPAGILVALTVPPDSAPEAPVDVMRGVGALAQAFQTQVIGGDMTTGPVWSLAVTVLGRAVDPQSRAGAEIGDGIWVTGTLGAARAACMAWLAGDEPAPAARAAFVRPQPRIATARWLAEHGATAMMDISDGLGGDAPHLAAASGVALAMDVGAVPISPVVHAAVRKTRGSAALFAAAGGEDYELLVTMPAAFDHASGCEAATGVGLTRIGTVAAGRGVRFTLNGADVAVEGFRHAI